jgi:hypothetical protein
MLIDNKFIYLSLPRCASTAFFISSIRSGFDVKHSNPTSDKLLENSNLVNLTNMDLVYKINHFHETITSLRKSFGGEYDVISVKRNKYERFISYFNHCIGELKRNGNIDLSNKFLELTTDEVLFYKTNNLIDKNSKINLIKTFLKNINYFEYNKSLESLLLPMVTPISLYHNNDPKIIWFDFNKLDDMENWVSQKTQKNFKLEFFGSSKNNKSKLNVDDNFIKKYDEIYDYYDIFKKQKTII